MLHTHIEKAEEFVGRHIGPNDEQQAHMLKAIGLNSLDELVNKINSADKKFEEFTLDELEHFQKIDKYQSC